MIQDVGTARSLISRINGPVRTNPPLSNIVGRYLSGSVTSFSMDKLDNGLRSTIYDQRLEDSPRYPAMMDSGAQSDASCVYDF